MLVKRSLLTLLFVVEADEFLKYLGSSLYERRNFIADIVNRINKRDGHSTVKKNMSMSIAVSKSILLYISYHSGNIKKPTVEFHQMQALTNTCGGDTKKQVELHMSDTFEVDLSITTQDLVDHVAPCNELSLKNIILFIPSVFAKD